MREVQWVKLSTDLFKNPKINYLRRLPEGDRLALIWVMLLTLAGRCNAGGAIFLTENTPYTPKMLADELGIREKVILSALSHFEQLDMIRQDSGYIILTGWEEQQNTEGLEKIREQNRLRKQKQRENQKLHTSRDSHAADIDIEREEDKEKEIKKESEEKTAAKKAKRFVPPTLDEVKDYCMTRKSTVDPVRFWEYFDTGGWVDSGGNPVRNWKQKLITWENHTKEKGNESNDTTGDNHDGHAEWNINYTFDARAL
ncbi:MAG: phage replisome organizer N-terminal domain-containing protein [Eubacteriales bacterium]|nr:phage replisome organizer N-terminal domain-containing protein [Eubacteriales bacterium]